MKDKKLVIEQSLKLIEKSFLEFQEITILVCEQVVKTESLTKAEKFEVLNTISQGTYEKKENNLSEMLNLLDGLTANQAPQEDGVKMEELPPTPPAPAPAEGIQEKVKTLFDGLTADEPNETET